MEQGTPWRTRHPLAFDLAILAVAVVLAAVFVLVGFSIEAKHIFDGMDQM